ncbi:MAG: hypothetical protein ABJB76_09715 [Candidatus Nitrosocosmicus sp.]
MSEIRVEFLIPQKYNDGSLVEEGKLIQTYDEIVERFTTCSMNNQTITGRWKDPKTSVYYDDILNSIWVICEDTQGNRDFFNNLRTILQERFKQESILMYMFNVSTTF